MITQSKDFLNNIHIELQNFLMNKQGDKDDLPAIWYAIDYDDVENTLKAINTSQIDNRAIIQGVESELREQGIYNTSKGKVQLIQADMALYTIVNTSYQEKKKRKILLNSLASDIKYKFDNYLSEIPHFRSVRINLPDGILKRDTDNVYSCRQDLYVEFYKKVR